MSGLILHLAIWQSHVFLLNSRQGHFSAPYSRRGPFSQSYRTNLPSSLATDHSSTFGFSPRLPVSVYGTGNWYLEFRTFSWEYDYLHYPISRSLSVLSGSTFSADLPAKNLSTPFNVLFRQHAVVSLLRQSFTISVSIGILTDCPSTFALRLRVRSRLTLIRLSLIRKP